MDQERLLARGEFEELKDELSSIYTQIRTLSQDIHRKLPIPDIPKSIISDISKFDIKGARALLNSLEELIEKYELIENKLKNISSKWGFRLNGN